LENIVTASTRHRIGHRAMTVASFAAGFAATFLPLTAMAAATLQVVQGSGEFQTLETAITVDAPKSLTMQWTTDQAATGGTWKVIDTATNAVVASGESSPAPAVGHMLRFSIPQNAFLISPSTSTTKKFNLSIQPHNGVMQAMGPASPNVVVTQVPGSTTPPIVFGPSANFPKVDIVSYEEKIGVVPQTQIHYAGADLTLRITNKSAAVTDPAWLAVKDTNVLMRQNTSVAIPTLQPGASTTVSVHLDAVLPAGTSQLPQDAQYNQWGAQYANVCGPQLSSVLDWRGPQAQTPIGSHLESLLVKEGWSDYAKVSPSIPVCQGTQCVRTCDIEKNIHKQLDGNATGYSFFVGQYPRFGSHGYARLSVDAPQTEFKSNTKITVASVSKLVSAIATVRMIDQKGPAMPLGLDTPISAFLPSDWGMQSSYIKSITFAQLLSQQSGIKDYGNVPMTYAQLKKFFTQKTSTSSTTGCTGPGVKNPSDPVNPNDMSRCYSNYNFGILRVLLPKLAGFAEDPNQATRPQTLADQYVKLVQQNVFDLVGQTGVTCKPPVNSTNYAFSYNTVGSADKGTDWGDNTLVCGAAGWYLSAEDMAKVMLSLNAKDGKIFPTAGGKDLFATMRLRQLGWDVDVSTELEKNGGWCSNMDANNKCIGDNVTTSVAVFGPTIVGGPRALGVLFVNSNITGGGGAQGLLEKAYKDALYTKP
jgi:CubicO group peptidase (beta-lactamase class C family)